MRTYIALFMSALFASLVLSPVLRRLSLRPSSNPQSEIRIPQSVWAVSSRFTSHSSHNSGLI